jgi:tetratricopeptide (TPR) repeat protein
MLALPGSDACREYRAHENLCGLFRALGRDDDAWEHARLAASAARRTGVPLFEVMALRAQARCSLRRGQPDDVARAVNEAFSTLNEASSTLGEDFVIERAWLLILRAECAVRQGRLTEAGVDLERTFALLEPLAPMIIAAGVHHALAHAWSVTGDLRSAQQDWDGAIAAWNEAVAKARHVASLPHAHDVYADIGLAYYLRGLAAALAASSRAEDARRAGDEREGILRRRGVPLDVP